MDCCPMKTSQKLHDSVRTPAQRSRRPRHMTGTILEMHQASSEEMLGLKNLASVRRPLWKRGCNVQRA